jgi:hypothetical protein
MTGAESRKTPAIQIPFRPVQGRFIIPPLAYFPWFSEIPRAQQV